MNVDRTDSESGTGIYVLAWVLASIFSYFTSYAVGTVASSNIRTVDDLLQRMLFVLPISVVVSAGVMIGVYSLFPRIRVSKVIPFFWGLGALGILIELVRTSSSGVNLPGLFYALIIVEFVLKVLVLTWGFRRLGRM
jgi:hypothetical protein